MRVTVSHTKNKEEVMRAVDRSFEDLFRGIGAIPVQFDDERRNWQGSTLSFSFTAKMGFMSTPIKGIVEVTDRDLTIDADLGLFERLLPTAKVQQSVSGAVRGLLK